MDIDLILNLHHEVRMGNIEYCKTLIDQGANINIEIRVETPLYIAVYHGYMNHF